MAMDVAGVFLAIYTALGVKLAFRGNFDASLVWGQTKDIVALATLVTLLLFAKSDLYADRAQRPGMARIVGSLFQVMILTLLFAVINGNDFSSYYIFYGSMVFAIVYISAMRYAYDRVNRHGAASRRLSAAGRPGRHRPAHRGRRPRAERLADQAGRGGPASSR